MTADEVGKGSPVRRILTLTAILGAVPAIGAVVSRIVARGDESSPDFRVAAIGGGRGVHANSETLRSLEAVAVMGGVELDLTDASPVPGGATINVLAVMGGVEVTVPETWAVQVEHKMIAGVVDARVPDIEGLPADAPQLTIHVRACMGGVKVGTTTS